MGFDSCSVGKGSHLAALSFYASSKYEEGGGGWYHPPGGSKTDRGQ